MLRLRVGLQTPLRAGLQAPSLTMLSSTPKCCCTGLTPPCLCWCLLQGPSQLARRARLHTLLQPGSSSELDGEAHGCYRCEHPTARREHPGQTLPMGYRRCARRRGAWGVTGCLTLAACDLYSHSLANSGGGGGGCAWPSPRHTARVSLRKCDCDLDDLRGFRRVGHTFCICSPRRGAGKQNHSVGHSYWFAVLC